jgi:hypothetical protein
MIMRMMVMMIVMKKKMRMRTMEGLCDDVDFYVY